MEMFRQGDVLMVRADRLPAGAKELDREGDVVVLATGEASGHAHVIRDPNAALYESAGTRFLIVESPGARVTHEEHAPVSLPAGVFRVIRQQEYVRDDRVPRAVLD